MLVFGSDLAEPYGRGGDDGGLTFAQETSSSVQCAQQWGPRGMAQEAAQEEMANSKSRSLLARNPSFYCADVEVVDSAPFYKAVNRKSAPRRRGPASWAGGESGYP